MKLWRIVGVGALVSTVWAVSTSLKIGIDTARQTNTPPGLMLMGPTGPGPVDTRVTQANIHSTICVSGYTKSVRPTFYYTEKVKKMEMGNGGTVTSPTDMIRTYQVPGTRLNQPLKLYELDHNVPLEVGGNPEDPQNLKLQIWNGPDGAHVKDLAENKVHNLVCSGQMTLTQGQQVFLAGNWKAYT